MNKPERVVTALMGGTPDRVPYMYNTMMKGIQQEIIGHEIYEPTVDSGNITGWVGSPDEEVAITPLLTATPEVAAFLDLDSIQIQVLPPIFADRIIENNAVHVGNGCIRNQDILSNIKMPDPDDERLMGTIEEMIEKYKGDFALGARIRLGVSPTILSMGIDNLAYMSIDNPEVIHNVVGMYTNWSKRLIKNLNEMDFDYFWAFDDIAHASGPMVSPRFFREFFKNDLKDAAAVLTKPLIYHSDGNYEILLDDIIDIGANAIHPIERESMNHLWLKETYGKKLCLVGNIDINYTLTNGTIEEVENEVKSRIQELGTGGAYIISDSNSVPNHCKADNIVAMSRAVKKYRNIY